MTGRKETDSKFKARTFGLLETMPEYMTDFYYFYGKKAEVTKYHMIGNLKKFLDYAAKQYNISDIKELEKIDSIFISRYLADELSDLSDSSKGNHYASIVNLFDFAIKTGRIDGQNPCKLAERPAVRKEVKPVFMDSEELSLFWNNLKNDRHSEDIKLRNSCICGLMLNLGLRCGSVEELDIDDLDFQNQVIRLTTKGRFYRELPLNGQLAEWLERYLKYRKGIEAETDALFLSTRKNRLSKESIEKMVRRYAKGIDKHITAHKLRATCATNLYQQSGDIYLTATLLGHKQVETTMRYAGVTQKQLESAVRLTETLI